MKDNKLTPEKKKRLILITICVIAFIIIILFIFKLAITNSSKNKTDVNNISKMKGVYRNTDILELNSQSFGRACTSDGQVCVDGMDITFDGNKGLINYKIVNGCKKFCENEEMKQCSSNSDCSEGNCSYKYYCGDTIPAGKVRVELGGYKLVFPYSSLSIGQTYSGLYGYDDYDFSFETIDEYEVYHIGTGDSATMYEDMNNSARDSIVVN